MVVNALNQLSISRFVEFRSAISEIRWRKKKERKKEKNEETLVKYKSADILCRAA